MRRFRIHDVQHNGDGSLIVALAFFTLDEARKPRFIRHAAEQDPLVSRHRLDSGDYGSRVASRARP